MMIPDFDVPTPGERMAVCAASRRRRWFISLLARAANSPTLPLLILAASTGALIAGSVHGLGVMS